MKAAGKELISRERKDRCARVAASGAYHLVELMSEWKDSGYSTKGTVPTKSRGINAQHDCADCHGSNIPSAPISSSEK